MLVALSTMRPTLTTCRAALNALFVTPRTFTSAAVSRPAPEPRGNIKTPQDFLVAIGRKADEKITEMDWTKFWQLGGFDLRKSELAVRDRRYILWAMNKYRLGQDPKKFAHEAKPKKTIRGWGPAVQNGKRIRSRRKQ